MKKGIFLTALVAAIVSLGTYTVVNKMWKPKEIQKVRVEHRDLPYTSKVLYTTNENGELVPLDFTQTAAKVMDAVVRIESKVPAARRNYGSQDMPDPFREFFEGNPFFKFEERSPRDEVRPKEREEHLNVGTGSGVIINKNGYIVTNNHVVEGAKEVDVFLNNNRSYEAEIIGTDPTTDLALLKIKNVEDLPVIHLVNSDDVKIGEWVLAIGNPLNLGQTVTAGIVSALGKNINILRDQQYRIESFIQTDAAINKGNSGGALVNLNGDLIGINSAIASPTGYYNGYGFAIPSNLVNKVVEDLMKFGEVQRGVMGVLIRDLKDDRQKAENLGIFSGGYVDSVFVNSGAAIAGIKEGDVITKIEGEEFETTGQLIERIGIHRPGESVNLTVIRDGKEKNFDVVLKSAESAGNAIASNSNSSNSTLEKLGVDLENVTKDDLADLPVESGVKVKKLFRGVIYNETAMQEGFIITKIGNKTIKDVDDFVNVISKMKGGVLIEGYYPGDSSPTYYGFGLG